MYFYLLLIYFSFYLISGEEPYHRCTDVKPLLLLLLLLLLYGFRGKFCYKVVEKRCQLPVINISLFLITEGFC